MDLLRPLFVDERFISIIAVILTSVLSYIFTKKSENKKHNVETNMIQLKKIFLPLYLLIYNKKIENIDFENLFNNMVTKKKQYFLYLPRDYVWITEQLEKELSNGVLKKGTKKLCKQYIEFEYFQLRKTLGFSNRIEEYFNACFFYILKRLICSVQIILLLSTIILLIFGNDIYDLSRSFYNIVERFFIVYLLIDFILIVSFVVYDIIKYLRFKIK